jgi:multicomponent Na+:H+ antiporter subunit B
LKRAVAYLLLLGFFGVFVYASLGLPRRGDATGAIHQVTSAAGTPVAGTYYITNAYRDARTDNIVTVVLADYRGFDTLGETLVVFAAGIACFLLLRRTKS